LCGCEGASRGVQHAPCRLVIGVLDGVKKEMLRGQARAFEEVSFVGLVVVGDDGVRMRRQDELAVRCLIRRLGHLLDRLTRDKVLPLVGMAADVWGGAEERTHSERGTTPRAVSLVASGGVAGGGGGGSLKHKIISFTKGDYLICGS
jgi:hypothetical protein